MKNVFARSRSASILLIGLFVGVSCEGFGEEAKADDPYLRNPDSLAASQDEMKPYTQRLRHSDVTFDMIPIPEGEFLMGSPATELHRQPDEGPQHRVQIEPFWMGKYEVTWNEFDAYRNKLDLKFRQKHHEDADEVDQKADAITRPTTPYTDMSFGMGRDGFPVINMTQLGATMYCAWLTEKTGQYYRLPTEAEWEYACRAGTTTMFSFGDDISKLDEYAWYWKNSEEDQVYHKVGKKKPNPWGLYDMHGNVSEWCLDQYHPDFYQQSKFIPAAKSPYLIPRKLFPRVVRGGSWFDDPEELRSANRIDSSDRWKAQDPQLPQSMWYLTDGDFVGFRVVRPLKRPSEEEILDKVLYPDIPKELIKD